jgi:hypothetical protein
MVISETVSRQVQLDSPDVTRSTTVFSPPGVTLSTTRYPILLAGVLASPQPSEYLSIYDHSESWGGLERDTILNMRRNLYRLVLPVDAREMQPSNVVELLQTMALAVSPVALEVEAPSLPPRTLQSVSGLLPCGPAVRVRDLSILSEPEISKVAERVTQRDVPASEAIWKLIDYDYSIDQVARIMSVGLLGRLGNRRLVPLNGAYKAVIDAFINKTIMDLTDRPIIETSRIHVSTLFGDTFTVLIRPGEARVDYLRLDKSEWDSVQGTSFESSQLVSSDPKTSIYADHARFASYHRLAQDRSRAHVTVFHLSRNRRNNLLGPWLARAGVQDALQQSPVMLDNIENALRVLDSILSPGLQIWGEGNPLLTSLGLKPEMASSS